MSMRNEFLSEEEWQAGIDAADLVLQHALMSGVIRLGTDAVNGEGMRIRKKLAYDIARAVIISSPNDVYAHGSNSYGDILDGSIPGVTKLTG